MKADQKDSIDSIINAGEGQTIEFKEGINGIDREIVAFANASGGSILVGVDDTGKKTGIQPTNRLLSQIVDIARNCDPAVKMDLIRHGGSLLEIMVPQGKDRPYRCKDGFFLRIGACSQKLKRDEIVKLVLESGKMRFDELENQEFAFARDFDGQKFKDFLKLSGIGFKTEARDMLISLQLAKEDRESARLLVTNAAVLFFAKNPQAFIKESHITCVRYAGADRFEIIDRQDFSGSPIEMIESSLKFIRRNMKVGYEIGRDPRRIEVYDYPLEAIREATTNAVMHRDYYYDSSHTYVHMFSNRLEIENPGGLLPGLASSDLGKRSVRRNRLVADILGRAGYVEGVGSGFDRMKSALEKNGNPPFEISVSNFFTIRFSPRVVSAYKNDLTPRQTKLAGFVMERGSVTKRECAAFLAVSEDTALRELKILLKARMIKSAGSGKATSYKAV